jgi:long-chain acyl-CoA synthetase
VRPDPGATASSPLPFRTTAERFADRTALAWDGGQLSYQALAGLAAGWARSLARRGVKPGDRVALALGNRPDFAIALLGALEAGATAAPLGPQLTADERASILDDLGPALVVEEVTWTPGVPEPVAGVAGPALVLYTSGSTGRPKGALLSRAALAFAVHSWRGPVMALTPDDVVLAALPLAHSFGLNGALLAPLLAGATVIIVDRFSPAAVLAAIERHRVTVLPGVATMFRRLLEAPELGCHDLSSLRLAVSGAAPCPWELARAWRERTGVRILRGYGATELFRPISYLAADPVDLPDAVGRPVPGVEARIVDADGAPLPAGEVGELWIRSPAVMDGYLGAPGETARLLVDGWFRTGDLASRSADGFVRIAGRLRERILRGGYSVFPAEVEAVLAAHPAVAEVAVVGVEDADLGEEVAAFVVPRTGAAVSPDELVAHCRARLAAYKCPRIVTLVEELPRSLTGKVAKSRLAALTRSERDARPGSLRPAGPESRPGGSPGHAGG